MRPYQEEYIANSRAFNALTMKRLPEDTSFEAYAERMERCQAQKEELAARNMELLRGELLPTLDCLPDADEETLAELGEYAGKLFNGRDGLDLEQFCQIHRSLLSLARQRGDRDGIIRELYWLGIGQHTIYGNKLAGTDEEYAAPYIISMRLYFAEAVAYLKYFDELENTETRGYIMRSLANCAMGERSISGRMRLLERALKVFQDPYYREKAPELPWERYVRQTHMLISSSLPHNANRAVSPQDVSQIMESAYIIYYHRAEQAKERGEPLPAQQMFRVASIEFFCGVSNLASLLTIMEELMDAADPHSFSDEDMYRMISLPAFYCQYLEQFPEAIPSRTDYLAKLYRRIMDYMDDFPRDREDEQLFLYVRQLSTAFVEAEHTIPYGVFMARALRRFAPEVYVHSEQVAAVASALCGLIMDEEPGHFDDIDFVREVPDAAEKREAVVAYALGCGRFHDVGKTNFMELYIHTAREWMEEEYQIARLHTVKGAAMLSERESTARYVPAALGHHAWYDGSRGYPEGYKRLECPERQMVDVIALADWLAEAADPAQRSGYRSMGYEEAAQAAIAQEGRRFSPLLTARLRDPAVAELVKKALEDGRREAYRKLYER